MRLASTLARRTGAGAATLCLAVACLLGGAPACAQVLTPKPAPTLTLGLAHEEAVQDIAADLLAEIYRRAGLRAEIRPLPPARITSMVLKDELDGEVARIGPYFERNPSLVRVEPAHYYLVTTAFAKSARGIRLASAADLRPYRVGIIRGVYHAAIVTEGHPNLEVTDSVQQLFRMLDADRIDIAIDVGVNGLDTIGRLKLQGIVPVAELARRDLFNVLVRSRAELAPRISSVIRALKASGELAALTDAAERRRLGAIGAR